MFRFSLFFTAVVLFLFSACESNTASKNEFVISGKAEGVFNGVRVYLKTSENGQKGRITDTAIVVNEAFNFKGKIDGSEMRILTIDGIVGQTALVLEPEQIEVTIYKDSIYQSEVSGGNNNVIFNSYKNGYQDLVEKVSGLRQAYVLAQGDADAIKEIQERNTILRSELKDYGLNFLKQNPDSDFSLMLLDGITGQQGFDAKMASEVFELMPQALLNKPTNTIMAQKINAKINIALNTFEPKIGAKAPDFTAPNPDGEMITLSNILGKVTILDFWASWCRPCRIENPNFVKIYEQYHAKGLEIISVSLDRNNQKQRWVEAIEKDQLNWYNVSNLKFWQDPLAQLYNVSSIPATFILDKDGVILATKLRGGALEAKISELLDN
jgi:peroxiredoxin